MAARIRTLGWADTPLGPIQTWPQSLRTAVDMILAMPGPATILWGPEHVQLYNDAYVAIAKERHPALLGRPVIEGWPDVYKSVIAPILESVSAGRATRLTGIPVPLAGLDSRLEERVFDTDWSPIRDESGAVAGALQTLVEASDRLKAQAALRESEARHRLMIESWAQAVWETDIGGVVIADSPSWRAYTGQTLDEWLGYGWLDAIHPDDRAYAERQWREAIAARGLVNAEFRLRAPGGGWRWTNVRAAPVLDAEGRIKKWAGMNIDIDARKRAEAGLRASEERNAFLVRFSDAVRSLSDPTLVAKETCRILSQQLGTEGSLWAVLDWEAREYVSDWAFFADGTTAEPSRWPFDERDPFAAEHLAGHPVVYDDVALDLRIPDPVKAAMTERGLLAGIAVPVLVGGKLVAVLNTSQSSAPRRWTAEEVAFVEALAQRAWAEIERARIKAALSQSEAEFRLLFESVQDGFCVIEVLFDEDDRPFDYKFLKVNPAFERQTGLVDPIGRTILSMAPEHEPFWIAIYARIARTGQSERFDHRADALGRWYEVDATPIGEPGENQVAVVFRDVLQKRKAEEALRESEEKYRALFDSMDEAYAVVEVLKDQAGRWADFRFIEVNPAFMIHTNMPYPVGQTATELLGTPNPRWAELYGHALDTGEPLRVEESEATLGITLDLNIFALDRERNRVAVLFTNITERKRAEAALRESEERFRSLTEGIPQLVWRAGPGGHWTWSSPQWEAFTGQTREETLGHGWLAAVHPNDRKAATEAWQQAVETGRMEAEYRLRKAGSDRYRWFQVRATAERDGNRLREWLGTCTDIDELRRLRDEQAILVGELQHRTRNLLAVVSGISQQTLDASGTLADFGARFDQRLAALGRVQGLLSRGSEQTVDLAELLRLELRAHGLDAGAGDVDKLTLSGPEVPLPARIVQTLALALHELMTNAVKHGALKIPDGHLTIAWEEIIVDAPVGDRAPDHRLRLDWMEASAASSRNGPPARRGFGRELIEDVLPYELDARTDLVFAPDGVRCTIELPLAG
ncbi:PAS domain S-box protein [Azospirillum melinis]